MLERINKMELKVKLPWPYWTLFIIFLILKLTSVISWSWWWVTAPLWGPLAFVLAIAIGGVIIGILVVAFAKIFG